MLYERNGIFARALSRDRILRNINILADEAHWRLPKCPDGASTDQVPADYRGGMGQGRGRKNDDAIIRASTVDVVSLAKGRMAWKKTTIGRIAM